MLPELPRIPLLYVLSSGRSGSTLLDLLLGSLPGVHTLGELQLLGWEREAQRSPCGCGESVLECSFWSEVAQRRTQDLAGPPAAPLGLGHFRNTYGHGQVLRRPLLAQLRRGVVDPEQEAFAERYAALNERLLRTTLDVAEEQSGQRPGLLVDASKDPYRLLWLATSPAIDLYVVHLVKDPRAFVYSMTRRDRSSSLRNLRFAARWAIENALSAQLLSARFPQRGMTLRYEDLAQDPAGSLDSIHSQLELPVATQAFDPDAFRSATNHALSGNQMRWEAGGIQLDERWRRDLKAPWPAIVSLLTWPVRGRLGYA